MTPTSHPHNRRRLHAGLVVCLLATAVLLGGCGSGSAQTKSGATAPKEHGANMAGPQVQVHIPVSAIRDTPKAPNLSTPETAVRAYLDWISYAYRVANSEAATPTTGAEEAVRVDAYIQDNLEKKRLIDQTLKSITFGQPTVVATVTVLPTREEWSYVYRSIDVGNRVTAGPYTATYDVTYRMIHNKTGGWIVDSLDAKAAGTVQ